MFNYNFSNSSETVDSNPAFQKKHYYFLSGVARSGSTVLASILAQNPKIFSTPTSPLLDMLIHTENAWKSINQSTASGSEDQLANIYQGIIYSIWGQTSKPFVLDKHRAWPRNVRGIKNIFGYDPKILVTVRTMAEVQASFLRLIKRKPYHSFIDRELLQTGRPITDENRLDLLWNNYTQDPWMSVKVGWENYREYIHLVEYEDLHNSPEETIRKIYDFLELPFYQHNFTHIVNSVKENDAAWGLDGLHDIRPVLKRISPSAEEELGVYAQKYKGLEFWREKSL